MKRPTRFDGMMHEICVGLGFCGGTRIGVKTHVTDHIPETGVVTAAQFATWVMETEGVAPGESDPIWSELRSVFVRHMGHAPVDAATLKRGVQK